MRRTKKKALWATCGIVDLSNAGKSTLFNTITAAGAEAANCPFCTIDPNIGKVAVPIGSLTSKPVMYVCNVHEKEVGKDSAYVKQVREVAAKEGRKLSW